MTLLSSSPASAPASQTKLIPQGTFLVLGFVMYQFAMCFVGTNFFPVTNTELAIVEGSLLILVGLRISRRVSLNEIAFVIALLFYFIVLSVFNGKFDLEGPRHIIIALLAFTFGRTLPDRQAANKIVWIISLIVLFDGAIEWAFTDLYLRFFDILGYYIGRGETDAQEALWAENRFAVNGMRAIGRSIFPFIGDWRMSSIFLEPVSLGNYATILGIWAFCLDETQKRQKILHILVAAILIVCGDSRFCSVFIGVLFLLNFLPKILYRPLTALMPIFALSFLVVFTVLALGDPTNDNYSGRLMRSGLALVNMPLNEILGDTFLSTNYADMGFAYSINHFGIVLCFLLWGIFSLPNLKNTPADRYRFMFACYILSLLMISGKSGFSSKTAFLGWFLYGVLYANAMAERPRASAPLIGMRGRTPKPEGSARDGLPSALSSNY